MCKVDRCKWPSKRKVYLGFLRLLLRYIWQSYLLFFMTESVLINNITKPDFIFQTQAAFVLWSCLYFYFLKVKPPEDSCVETGTGVKNSWAQVIHSLPGSIIVYQVSLCSMWSENFWFLWKCKRVPYAFLEAVLWEMFC